MDTVHNAMMEPVRRLEVFTGAGRRRKWSHEDKARIVGEIEARGESVCSVARRHGLSPQQLFGWRRQLREAGIEHSGEGVQFVPAVVGAVPTAHDEGRKVPRCKPRLGVRARHSDAGVIEVEIDGVTIRVGRGADVTMITTIVQALKAGL